MNTELSKIASLISETANGDNWTGINAEQALKDISAEQAIKRINENHLNIAELTAHLTCWNHVIAKRLNGESMPPSKEEDFPVINVLSENEWSALKYKFMQSFKVLTEKIETTDDEILEKPIFVGASSTYRNLHGQIAHLHYHIAQIVLLKKIL